MPVVPKQVLPLQLFVPIVALRVNACIVCVSVRFYWEKGTGGEGSARARVYRREEKAKQKKKGEQRRASRSMGQKQTNKQNKISNDAHNFQPVVALNMTNGVLRSTWHDCTIVVVNNEATMLGNSSRHMGIDGGPSAPLGMR